MTRPASHGWPLPGLRAAQTIAASPAAASARGGGAALPCRRRADARRIGTGTAVHPPVRADGEPGLPRRRGGAPSPPTSAGASPTGTARLQVDDGWRTLPYLARGSAGIGMVIGQFLAHRGNETFADAARAIRLAASSGLYAQAGLFNGRAGMIACLAGADAAGATTRSGRASSPPMSTGWPGTPCGTPTAWRSPATCCCASRWTWAPAPPASCWARPRRSPPAAPHCRSSPGPQASPNGCRIIPRRPSRETVTTQALTRR